MHGRTPQRKAVMHLWIKSQGTSAANPAFQPLLPVFAVSWQRSDSADHKHGCCGEAAEADAHGGSGNRAGVALEEAANRLARFHNRE